jgi:RNA polymerase sigma factor (sigma-70 family)
MSMAFDDYIYCSPFLNVASLDHILSHPGEDGKAFDIVDPQPSTEVRIDRQRAYDTIHGAVDNLPPRQRAVIRALYFLGRSVTETARLLKVSAAAVVKLRAKALKHLMTVLAPVRDTLFA